MKHYTQLTREERYTIAKLRANRMSNPEIAKILGRHRSTIYREVRMNKCNDGGYRVFKATRRTNGRRSRSRRNKRLGKRARNWAIKYLKQNWSPDQVSNTLSSRGIAKVSHETIYSWIWADKKEGGTLWTHLRQSPKKRRKRRNSRDSRGRLGRIGVRPHHFTLFHLNRIGVRPHHFTLFHLNRSATEKTVLCLSQIYG